MIRLLILLLVVILYFTFVLNNMEEMISLKYLGLSTQPLPVYLLVLGALIIGMLLASILVLPGWIRMRMEMRRQRKTIEQMEQELSRLAAIAPDKIKSAYANEPEES